MLTMSKKIYITEAQIKALTRSLLRENTNINYVEQFIENIKPVIEVEISENDNGVLTLIFKNENNEEIQFYADFKFDYSYEGEYRSATRLTPEEYPDFVCNVNLLTMSLFLYTNNIEEEIENVDSDSIYYNMCIGLFESYEDNIKNKIEESDDVMPYHDYMDDMRERSLGI